LIGVSGPVIANNAGLAAVHDPCSLPRNADNREEQPELSHGNSITCVDCAGSAPTFAVFCPNCDALLPPFTTVDPYKRTIPEKPMYWRTIQGPMNPIVVASLWLLFCLTFLLGVGALAQAIRDIHYGLGERLMYAILGCASATLSITFGSRVYRNLRKRSRQSKHA
jgi:hypothetical protein